MWPQSCIGSQSALPLQTVGISVRASCGAVQLIAPVAEPNRIDNICSEQTDRLAHRGLDVQRLDVLPVLLEQRDEEINAFADGSVRADMTWNMATYSA